MNPSLSVITPVYNGENFIEQCITNIVEQHCPSVEHLIMDGASTDNTLPRIRKYSDEYPHIRLISEKDRGQSDAMNKGIKLASGKIISFLNVDDYYEPGVLNRVSKIFNNCPEPSLVVGNCNIWNDSGQLIGINKPSRLQLEDLLLGPAIHPFPMNPSAYFYHRSLHELIGYYDIENNYVMDLDFILRAVQAANLVYKDELWGNFQMVSGSKSVEDEKEGQALHRMEEMLGNFRKDLPAHQQIFLPIRYLYHSHMIAGFKYYFKNPDKLPVLREKVLRILGFRDLLNKTKKR